MHISEGILSGQVLASGMVLSAVGVYIGFKALDYDRMPQTAILSAAFFVASLVHVPIGPSSVHLILNGLVGILLWWAAFPAIMIALLLQAMIFQFGGITTLGVNTVIMATPAVISFYIFKYVILKRSVFANILSFACGFFSVFLSAILVGCALFFTEKNFLEIAAAVVLAHLPVMVIEGIITAFCIAFLKKVQPELFSSFYHA